MLPSLSDVAGMECLIVVNGDPDSIMMPSHLGALGFPLLRPSKQVLELSDVLSK